MSRGSASRFAVRVAGVAHDLSVVRLRGRERINGLYRFDLEVLTSRRVVAGQRALLGRAATLKIGSADGAIRYVHGVIAAQRVDGRPGPEELRRLRLRLVPRAWLMRHRARSRVFHRMSAVAIAMTVLREWGVEVESRVVGRAATLEHCVQHEESDLAFLDRLLARHGVAWWFDHPAPTDAEADEGDATRAELGGVTLAEGATDEDAGASVGRERVVLATRAEHYDTLPGGSPRRLSFGDAREAADRHDVSAFSVEARVRPTSARVTYHQTAYFQPSGGAPPVERADLRTGRVEAPTAEESLGLELDLHASEHTAFDANVSGARVVLERARADATRAEGESVVCEMRPGGRFELADHPYAELNRAWVVTEVQHRGEIPEVGAEEGAPVAVYGNRFACVASSTLVRPRFRRPAPRQVVEVATVVGTPWEDVYADAVGRIKVRFHWDRRRVKHEDERCCFVRKSESWAGAGWGAQFTPRPGMEVLVAFLDGDVDRPVIVGALYNEHNQPTFPREATSRRSGFRTSSIGGEGFNELSFEDLHGREQVYVHAQRDLRAEVLRDLDVAVRGDHRASVGGDSTAGVERSASVHVGRDLHVAVTRDLVEEVDGSHTTRVTRSRHDDVGGALHTSVGGASQGTVGGDLSLHITGSATIESGGRDGVSLEASGPVRVQGRDHVTVEAHAGVTLVCGEARVTLSRDRVEIVAPTVVVRGDDRVRVETGVASVSLDEAVNVRGDTVAVRSEGAALRLTHDAALEGARVHFGTAAETDAHDTDDAARTADEVRTFTVGVVALHAEGEAPEGRLLVLDGEGATVRAVPASEGREVDGVLMFSLPVASLPDPVEVVFEVRGVREHLIGPVSPGRTHDALMRRRAAALASGVARRARRARGGRS